MKNVISRERNQVMLATVEIASRLSDSIDAIGYRGLSKRGRDLPMGRSGPKADRKMGPIPWFSISLSIHAEDLDPAEVSALLDAQPDEVWKKGDTTQSGHRRRSGYWSIRIRRSDTDEQDLETAASMLLDRIQVDSLAWKHATLGTRFRLFFGVSLDNRNRGFGLSPEFLSRTAAMGLTLDFDIYNDLLEPAIEEAHDG